MCLVACAGRLLARRRRFLSMIGALCVILGVILAPVSQTQAGGAAKPDAYRLGVFPYLPVLKIDQIYGPVAAQFAEDLDRAVSLKTKTTFEKFAKELSLQSYDIVLLHPFFYVEAHDKYHYLPLARLEEPLTAVIVVPDQDSAGTLADLEGKTLALPSALSAVSKLIGNALIDLGLTPGIDVALVHYRTKQSCLQAVAIGLADACGLPSFALAQIDPDNERQLRTIFESDGISGFVFAVHARVPEIDRINLCKSILAWPYTAKGRRILAGGKWTRFVPAVDSDYDDVRRRASRLRDYAQR